MAYVVSSPAVGVSWNLSKEQWAWALFDAGCWGYDNFCIHSECPLYAPQLQLHAISSTSVEDVLRGVRVHGCMSTFTFAYTRCACSFQCTSPIYHSKDWNRENAGYLSSASTPLWAYPCGIQSRWGYKAKHIHSWHTHSLRYASVTINTLVPLVFKQDAPKNEVLVGLLSWSLVCACMRAPICVCVWVCVWVCECECVCVCVCVWVSVFTYTLVCLRVIMCQHGSRPALW